MTDEEQQLRYDIAHVESAGGAEDVAMRYQGWASEQSLSYGELAEWGDMFKELAEKYDLTEVFEENAII